MIPAVLTLVAIGLFSVGVASLISLHGLDNPTSLERSDPFYTYVTLLFSTAPRSQEFRVAQRRTIWLFCAAILLLYLARVAFLSTSVG